MNTLIECKGTILFSPVNVTKKHDLQKEWKRVALVETKDDLADYYYWFLKKRFDIHLVKPLRGSHVTFINDKESEIPKFNLLQKHFAGKEIKFYIDLLPKSNTKHWWLRVFSEDLEDIRELGGGNRTPYFGLHRTLGVAKQGDEDYQKYILNVIKKHNIIPFEERKEFKEYEIKILNS